MKLDSIEFQNESASIGLTIDARLPNPKMDLWITITTTTSTALCDLDGHPTTPRIECSRSITIENWMDLDGIEITNDQPDSVAPSLSAWVSNPQMADVLEFSTKLKWIQSNLFLIDFSAHVELFDLADEGQVVHFSDSTEAKLEGIRVTLPADTKEPRKDAFQFVARHLATENLEAGKVEVYRFASESKIVAYQVLLTPIAPANPILRRP
jgi:hypothetical protein